MLDIGFDEQEVLVNIRIRGEQSASGKVLAEECLREMEAIKAQISVILEVKKAVPAT
jgi:hypothetical protein